MFCYYKSTRKVILQFFGKKPRRGRKKITFLQDIFSFVCKYGRLILVVKHFCFCVFFL